MVLGDFWMGSGENGTGPGDLGTDSGDFAPALMIGAWLKVVW